MKKFKLFTVSSWLLARRIRDGRGEDHIFAGSVTAYDAELAAHRVQYDDGVAEWEVLGGTFAPRYCLE